MTTSLQQHIKERFPDGLTAIISIGGTRTAYILENNRGKPEPGVIDDMKHYMHWGMERTTEFIKIYFDLGGQNLLAPIFSFYRIGERDSHYVEESIRSLRLLIDDTRVAFYKANCINPYFGGIHELLASSNSNLRQVGITLQAFINRWDYKSGNRKLVWDVFSAPHWMTLNASNILGEQIQAQLKDKLTNTSNWTEREHLLYQYYCEALYGTVLPVPSFYIGDGRNRDLKIRSHTFALDLAGPTRLFYLTYPVLTTDINNWKKTLETIIQDLVTDRRLRTEEADYRGKITAENIHEIYNRFAKLASDTTNIIGLQNGH